jgi:hypothetical protein
MSMGINPVSMQRVSFDTVRYYLAILIFISLCTLIYFSLLCLYCNASIQTGAPYSKSGSIAPLYIVLSVPCLSPKDILADVCMYVCMYVCVYVCICMYVCVYVLCMHVYMYVCMCVYICAYVCMYVCVYVCMYVCVCICMYVCVYVLCMHVYMYVCMCLHFISRCTVYQ